jgi:hypothetical protein
VHAVRTDRYKLIFDKQDRLASSISKPTRRVPRHRFEKAVEARKLSRFCRATSKVRRFRLQNAIIPTIRSGSVLY